MNKEVFALIVAAGSGTRMKNVDRPKQFVEVNGKPLFVLTTEAFSMSDRVDKIVIATNEEYVNQVEQWCHLYKLSKVIKVVSGGKTRQESVYNGLLAIKELSSSMDDIVLIHDAARVMVSQEIINNNIDMCLKHDAVETAVKAIDTIAKSNNGEVINELLSRDEIYQVQTPQSFKLSLILKAHESAKENSNTDDASLVMMLGEKVYIVDGNKQNFKVTTDEDLTILKALLESN